MIADKNFKEEIKIKDEKATDTANRYLSLIHESDRAFEKIINYFKNQKEPTIVVMFGDHQPKLEDSFYELLYGKSLNSLSLKELQKKYTVPFIIWANYDIDEAAGKDTSVNYLAANVLKAADVPTNDYQSFLLKLQEEYPIISAVRTDKTADKTLDKASNKSDKATGSKNKQADSDMLNDYKLLQYYRLFDWEDK